MNREQFVRRHEEVWARTEVLLEDLDKRRSQAILARDFPELYRRCCHHLALARRRHYGADLDERLNSIALRGHHHLYRERAGSIAAAVDFLINGFPRLVRQHATLFWIATLLFYGPGLAMGWLVWTDPDSIHALLDAEQVEQYSEMYRARPDEERGSQSDLAMFGFYIYNNVGIAFRTYAGGALAGVGSIFFLTMNGLHIGAIFAFLIQEGSGENLLSFVVTHGAFELTGIVIAGVAGLKLGGAILAPGRQRRSEALRRAGPESVRLILGVAAMLFIAAFIEAFWSSTVWVPAEGKYATGAVAWGAVALYLLGGGRSGERGSLGSEQVAVTLRPRTSWEASDLGYTMVRHWWRPVYGAWLVVTLPLAVLLVSLFGGWGWLLFRWLRPLWDRVPLHILSRAVFGATPSVAETLRAVPGLFKRDLLGSLLWRRLDLARSFRLPIVQLEGLRGRERARRASVLAADGNDVGGWLTLGHQVMEVGLLIAGFMLLVVMTPDWADVDWELFFDRMFEGVLSRPTRIGLWLMPCLMTMLLEPFYVAAGFALYLNRRTRLEGWDLEIAFRRLARRAQAFRDGQVDRGGGARRAGAILALVLLGAGVLAPPARADEPAPSAWSEWDGAASSDPRAVTDQILERPEFERRITRSEWRLKDFDLEQPEGDRSSLGIGEFLAALIEPILWLAAIVGVAVLTVLVLRQFGLIDLSRRSVDDDDTPRTLFGLDITPESLPDDIPSAAEALWRQGRRAEAMSLLYRGALTHLTNVDEVTLRESFTEDDCLRAAGAKLARSRLEYLTSLTRGWQATAYAHRPPGDDAATLLWSRWRASFGGMA